LDPVCAHRQIAVLYLHMPHGLEIHDLTLACSLASASAGVSRKDHAGVRERTRHE